MHVLHIFTDVCFDAKFLVSLSRRNSMNEVFVFCHFAQKELVMKSTFGDTKYLLLMKWLVINVIGVVAVWVIWQTGWISKILNNDDVYLVRIILGLFVIAHK